MSHSQPSRWLVAATVTFYIISALSMVMTNKWVLKSSPIPLIFLVLQLFIAVLLLGLARLFNLLKFHLPARLELETARGLAPMIILNVLGLTFNTFTLLLVDASFYQIARGLVLPLTVLTSTIFLHARPSGLILLSCSVVALGFLVGVVPVSPSQSDTVRGFTPMGIVFGLLSSITTAMHVVVIKKSLAAVKNSALDLSWYSNILTSLVLVPAILVLGEIPKAQEFFATASPVELRTFWVGTAITGIGGFMISVAGILSVKITSPITHMVSSAVRGVLQTLLACWFFGDIITISKGSSVFTILAGSVWYTWIKHVESLPSKHPAPNGTANGGYHHVPGEDRERLSDVEQGTDRKQ